MAVYEDLSEEERLLLAILLDESGVDIAEFCWQDPDAKNADGKNDWLFRCWPYQYHWYRCGEKRQIDECGRAVGKSVGIQMRAFAFPFTNAGNEMLLTAPELIHLDPVTKYVEDRILSVRLSREMLKKSGQSNGINKRPFEAKFTNGAKIIGRIPQKDGKGVKTCVAGDTIILTARGMIPASEVKVGDHVLTHLHRWMPVRHVYVYPETETAIVSGAGHRGIQVSWRHTFYARRNKNPQRTRNLALPTWLHTDDDISEIKRHYWASPTNFGELEWPDGPAGISDGVELLRLAGHYLADGYLNGSSVHFVDDEVGIQHIEKIISYLGMDSYRIPHENAVSCGFRNAEVSRYLLDNFGVGSSEKSVPSWLLTAPEASRSALLEGYLFGDGHWSPAKNRYEASSASKALTIGVKLLGQSLGMTCSYSWTDPQVTEICGTPLISPPKRSHRTQLTNHGHGIRDRDMVWSKMRDVTPSGEATVYDFVVAEDCSYVGDGLVHLGSSSLPEHDEVW